MADYPEAIKKSVKVLCDELEKHYPKVFQQLYDDHGKSSTVGARFQSRMEMGVYIELIKAGVINE
jgi:hypothetical protein